MSVVSTAQAYNEVPYVEDTYVHTHPTRIGALARLHGIAAAPPDFCRVLELGCAHGANLVGMARLYPQSRFLGVDIAERQIADGTARLRREQLTHIELRTNDFRELSAADGHYDYIVAHGLFSWISPDLQQSLLATIKELLAPHGVAYVSYNAYPGWRLRGLLRDIMLYRSRYERGLMEKVKTSREFLDYLRQNILDQSNPMANYLEWEVNQLEACDDSYLAHEMFEPHNHPCYFHQFSTWTRDHGLQYLGDAETGRHLWGMLPEQQQADLLNQTSDPTELEQYTDFIVNRMFRKSLICHDNRFLCEDPGPAQMETLHVGGVIRAQNTSFDLTAGRPETFLTPNGTLAFSEPIEKAVFAIAGIHPEGLLFPRLIDTIEEALPLISRPERRVLEQRAIDILLASFRHGLVTLTLD